MCYNNAEHIYTSKMCNTMVQIVWSILQIVITKAGVF